MTAQLATAKIANLIATNSPEYFAEKYRSYGNKTVESILHMAFSVTQAKAEGKSCFSEFCKLINQDEKGSLIRKFNSIGTKFDFLNTKSEELPSNWTTLYKISTLDVKQIEGLMINGVITPLVTSKEINKALNIKPKAKSATKSDNTQAASKSNVPNGTAYEFRACMYDAPNEMAKAILKMCIASLNTIDIELEISPTLDEFLI